MLIPTWRRPAELSRCLAGLQAQTRRADEVAIVVRQGDDLTRSALADRPEDGLPLRSLEIDVPGVIAALNAGFASVSGDVVVVTDDDTVPRPDWLSRIEHQFEADPRVGGVGGRDWVHHNSRVEDGVRNPVGKLRWYGRVIGNHHLGAGESREADVLKGANMAYRREALEGVRVDERLHGGGAQVHFELDLSLAVKARGWKLIYDPAIAVDHYTAERPPGEEREQPPRAALADEVHNETYVLLKAFPWHRRLAALVYWLAIGSRRAPGIGMLAARGLRERDRSAALDAFRATMSGRLAGLRTFHTARPL